MDDKRFLRNFDLSQFVVTRDKVDLKVFKPNPASSNQGKIFIFSQTDTARIFFQNPDHVNICSPSDIFILKNEDVIPSSYFMSANQIYFISTCSAPLSTNNDGLIYALYRLFMFDLWDSLAKENFALPTIIADSEESLSICVNFLKNDFIKYKIFARLITEMTANNKGKNNDNVFIYATDNDSVLIALRDNLSSRGKKVFFINNSTGWQPDSGYNADEMKYMSDLDFAEYLITNKIGYVLFRNYFDMETYNQINKIWIMKQAGVTPISLIGDTMMEFPGIRFAFLHWLADTVHIINASVAESYDSFVEWTNAPEILKSPQIIEFEYKEKKITGPAGNPPPEGIIVTSNSRLMIAKTNKMFTLFLVPLVRELFRINIKIHHAYYLLIHAFSEADKNIPTEDLKKFYLFGSNVTLLYRSLIRYKLIQRAESIAAKLNIPFSIYGKDDWKALFPASYVEKYLNQEELYDAYRRNIVLIPTPSTSFLSQHPSIPKVLLLGGRVIAPAPFFTDSADKEFASQQASLKRFYFETPDNMETTIHDVMKGSAANSAEKTFLSNIYGINTLGNILVNLMDKGESNDWVDISGAKELISVMTNEEQETIGQFSQYILLMFNGLLNNSPLHILLNNIEKTSSGFMAQEVREILSNRNSYIRKLKQENDILAEVLLVTN